ncbi:MAG: OmpA family protein [Alphaproteobacteria bacterium]|nr:OmpA family protein [Alphaproteobacteria bacterium]
MFNNFRDKTNTWPAFVDLFSNLVIILIFLLIVFVFLWTTTSVFNKSTGVQTIAELKQANAEQSEKIRQMTADEQEAMQRLIQARARLESAQSNLDDQELSMIDLITAYENQVVKLQEQDAETKQQITDLRAQLNQAVAAKEKLADLEAQYNAIQEQIQAKMTEEYNAKLAKLNTALAAAEANAKDQEVKYVEMSNRLNKALADKVAELQDMKKYQSEFYRAIKLALGDTKSVRQDGDRFIVPSDILFSTGSYKLTAEGKNQLRMIANVIKELEAKIPSDVDWIIRVDGHTDTRPVIPGTRAYKNNMQLSLLRATAVTNELVRDGVARQRLVPSGFGDMHPFASGNDAASMQKNRRIELQLTNK